MVLWLIGMMGSGKTTVGEAVAARLGLSFVDTDLLITSVTGRSIPDIWEQNGEASFRDLEQQMIASAAGSGPSVVATGGGAVLEETNIAQMRSSGLVLWLTASPQTLEERIGAAAGRPLLAGKVPRERLESLLAERRTRYRAAAHQEVPTDDRPVEDVVSDVLTRWNAS